MRSLLCAPRPSSNTASSRPFNALLRLLRQDEFRKLGQAITGKEQSVAETKAQIARADFDNNCKLDLEEWLNFSTMLANLPENVFNVTVDRYTESVKKLNK